MLFDQLALALVIFFSILRWVVIIDVILSWSVLFGIKISIPFVREILDPMYVRIRKALPTSFSGLDFAPIVLLLIIMVCEGIVMTLNPSVTFML